MDDTQRRQAVDPPEVYYKVSDVANLFDVTPATVRVWLTSDPPILHGVKIGKGHYWRIPRSAVRELAQERYGANND